MPPSLKRTKANSDPRGRRTRAEGESDLSDRIDLALQGGGSHGAFTWGVLDCLLEDGSLHVDGVSGTSAGALNAAVLATGFARGGPAGSREALRAFWMDIASHPSCFGTWGSTGATRALSAYNLDTQPFFGWGQQWLRFFSPYQFNPLGLNPLREVVLRHVDEVLLREGPIRVFVTATDVESGQPEVFRDERLSLDALMASACLPQLFRAVPIAGRHYWDGGFSGNPAIWPLIYFTDSSDVLLVKINPLSRPGVPDTADEIADRVNEITFNAGLVGEMRAIHFVQELLREQRLDPGRYKDLRLHMVADEVGLAALRPSSKLNTDRGFLLALFEQGRQAAQTWLSSHRQQVGRASSVDIAQTFLSPRQTRGAGEAP